MLHAQKREVYSVRMADEKLKLWFLSRVNLFRELSPEALHDIAERARMRDFERNAYIETPADEFHERIYFLKKGEVEIYEATPDGHKIIVDILGEGDIFGYTALGEASPNYPAGHRFIKATSPVTVCTMPHADFLALIERKPRLALSMIKQLSLELADAEGRLRETALEDAETRTLEALERIWRRYGAREGGLRVISRRFTHERFAQFVGAARETITRALASLAKKRKISINAKGNIILHATDADDR